MNTNAESALVYNDNSINENMHASIAWRLLQQPQNNFLEHLPEEEQRFVRRTLIQIILATDMAGHSTLLKVLPNTQSVTTGCCWSWEDININHNQIHLLCTLVFTRKTEAQNPLVIKAMNLGVARVWSVPALWWLGGEGGGGIHVS